MTSQRSVPALGWVVMVFLDKVVVPAAHFASRLNPT